MTTPALPSVQTTRGLVTLTPCELLPKDPDTERGLAAANGINPDRALTLRGAFAALTAVAAFIILFLVSGCSSLEALGEGAKMARDAAKIGCAILEGTDGTTKDVLERTQALQRELLTSAVQTAAAKGVDENRLQQDMRTIEALADTLRTVSLAVVQASGNTTAKLNPCPAPPAEAPPKP